MKTLMLSEGKLVKQPFVRGADTAFINSLAQFATEASFRKGEIIFREGEIADRFFLVLTGKVELETRRNGHSKIVVQTLGPGEPLGWSWLFAPFQWHFTARALEPCTVLAFNGASLLVRAEEDPVFGYELMKRVSRQVIQRLQATRDRFIHKLAMKESNAPNRAPVLPQSRVPAVSNRHGRRTTSLAKTATTALRRRIQAVKRIGSKRRK